MLAVNELATNSVRHGGGDGRLRLWAEDDRARVRGPRPRPIDEPLAGRQRPQAGPAGRLRRSGSPTRCATWCRSARCPTGGVVRCHAALPGGLGAGDAAVPADQVRRPLADHDRRRVRVAAHDRRHDRAVDDAQALDAVHAQLAVDDGVEPSPSRRCPPGGRAPASCGSCGRAGRRRGPRPRPATAPGSRARAAPGARSRRPCAARSSRARRRPARRRSCAGSPASRVGSFERRVTVPALSRGEQADAERDAVRDRVAEALVDEHHRRAVELEVGRGEVVASSARSRRSRRRSR